MKVYLDENLSPGIARMLRAGGLDAVSAHEAGKGQLDDHAQLTHATRDGRAIVTANVSDFIDLARAAVRTNTEHAGIILIPSSIRGDELRVIADGIREVVKSSRGRLRGLVVYIRRQAR